MLATFAHASARTSATAIASTRSVGRTGPKTTDMNEVIRIVAQASDRQVTSDTAAALKFLDAQAFVDPARMGVTGFCWGGGKTWLAAERFAVEKLHVSDVKLHCPLILTAVEVGQAEVVNRHHFDAHIPGNSCDGKGALC